MSGGATIVFLLLYSARGAAETPTNGFQDSSSNEEGVAAQLSFGSSKPGHYDKEGCPIITVVDKSGIHKIGVNWCHCSEGPDHDMQLMMAGLFSAMFHNLKTAFTFQALEDFHLDNLECKTTAGQSFSHLRRLTNDEFSK